MERCHHRDQQCIPVKTKTGFQACIKILLLTFNHQNLGIISLPKHYFNKEILLSALHIIPTTQCQGKVGVKRRQDETENIRKNKYWCCSEGDKNLPLQKTLQGEDKQVDIPAGNFDLRINLAQDRRQLCYSDRANITLKSNKVAISIKKYKNKKI